MRHRWVVVLGLVGACGPSVAGAQPIRRTWGAPPDAGEVAAPDAAAPRPEGPLPGAALPPGPAPPDVPGLGVVRTPSGVGLKYTLEGVAVRGNRNTLARVVLRYVPFRPGDVLDVNDREIELTRFRLLGTGFFRDVQLSLARGSRRGAAVLIIDVVERNTVVVNGLWLGLSEDVGPDGKARPLTAYGGASVTEANLAGTGVALGGAFAVADGQLGLRVRLTDPQFLRTEWIAEAEVLYGSARDFYGNGLVFAADSPEPAQGYAVAQYKRFGGRIGFGHDLGISTQLLLDYRLEKIDASLPAAASDYRGLDVEPIDFMLSPGSSILSTIGATIVNDTRDEPFLTTRGHRLTARLDASLTPLGSDYPYVKVVLGASQWFALPWGHVLQLETIAGAIFGDAPLFERFYVGDLSDFLPDRALDLNFDRRPSPNFFRTDVVEVRYGEFMAKVDAEYRVPLYRGTRSVYGVDLFASAGLYALGRRQDVVDAPRGYEGLARVPIDLTFNAGLRIDTQVGGFVLGLANFVGFAPVGGAAGGAVRP